MRRLGHIAGQALQGVSHFLGSLRPAPEAPVVDPAQVKEKGDQEWTVMVCMDGSHRLAESTLRALDKMEAVGSDANVHVVAQATLSPTLGERFMFGMKPSTTQRFYLRHDKEQDKINSPVVADLGQASPLNADSLADFVRWSMKEFPAKRFALVVKKHGAGFASMGSSVPLSARELDQALTRVQKETGRTIDVLSFDSCSMQQTEVAYQVKDQARVMTGSCEDVYADRFPYATILTSLQAQPRCGAAGLGEIVVKAHEIEDGTSIHSSLDLSKMSSLAASVSALSAAVREAAVPRNLLYTLLQKTPSLEPGDTAGLSYGFRDMGAFLTAVATDSRIPAAVQALAKAAREDLRATILSHYASPDKKARKAASGPSTFLPWRLPSQALLAEYDKLDYSRDSGWGELLNYILEPGPASSRSEKAVASLGLAKGALRNYKKYISPFLDSSCPSTPSCSQYAREAVEIHGMIEGGKMGAMRLLSCNEHSAGGHDPVPGSMPDAQSSAPPEPVLLTPPAQAHPSVWKSLAVLAARAAGTVVGGVIAAMVGAPLGAVAGGYLGLKAGAGSMDQVTAALLQRYQPSGVMKVVEIAHLVGDSAYSANLAISAATGSATMGALVGGAVGLVGGTIKGLLGGAAVLGQKGALFTRVWAGNVVKDTLGDLPQDPNTETILQHDYAVK